jgi:ACS family pantothenate transporter-like MFS transporter
MSLLVWIPFLEIGWTVFTFALAGAKSYHQLLAIRFVVGLFEAGYWPALYYILGSWYTKRKSSTPVVRMSHENISNDTTSIGELGKRNGILQAAVSIAPIFSGFLQAGIFNSLNGHLDLAGWRWLFSKLYSICIWKLILNKCKSHQWSNLFASRPSCVLLHARYTWHCQG